MNQGTVIGLQAFHALECYVSTLSIHLLSTTMVLLLSSS